MRLLKRSKSHTPATRGLKRTKVIRGASSAGTVFARPRDRRAAAQTEYCGTASQRRQARDGDHRGRAARCGDRPRGSRSRRRTRRQLRTTATRTEIRIRIETVRYSKTTGRGRGYVGNDVRDIMFWTDCES
ncbi:hypothetical protein ACJJTC_016617 [Scirpophaga incertulas]